MIKKYTQNQINELANILKNDGIISVPTDTVYGICGKITSIKAYNKLINIKNRPINKSFPIMCADKDQIKQIASINEKAEKIINFFMPGPITIVVRKNKKIPDYISNGKDTIAIRMATSNVLKKLIQKIESPIFMTSANQSGNPTCTNLEEIEKACPTLDGIMEGKVTFGVESTIVDCSTKEVKILRKGPISLKQITEVLVK